VSASADRFFQRLWYGQASFWLSWLMLPLSGVFRLVVAMRRGAYRIGLLRRHQVGRPVIVVGNISVGGTGKTPFTLWLAQRLRERGMRVGIILRGYGGNAASWPREVTAHSPWEEVGDEAVLLAARTGAIVVAGPDRVADAQRAIALGAQIILSDDGLQHYRLARDMEIAVVDGGRGLGNGRLLPAGPLREPRQRLSQVDLVVFTRRMQDDAGPAAWIWMSGGTAGGSAGLPVVCAHARLMDAVCIATGERRTLEAFQEEPVHAVAGIGNPQAFFDALSARQLRVRAHALPDHARISRADLDFMDELPVLMTEKDAVKCREIADRRHWAVGMETVLDGEDVRIVSELLDRLLDGGTAR